MNDSGSQEVLSCPECENFLGRDIDLCTGEGHDGRARPRRSAVDQFRADNGLEPIQKARPRPNAASPRTDHGIREKKPPKPPAPQTGPGTEFHELSKSITGKPATNCGGCLATLARMNQLGVAGCREQREELIAEIRSRAIGEKVGKKFTWEWWEAARNTITSGIAFEGWINPNDPVPGLFDIAVKRAEAKAATVETSNGDENYV